MPRLPLTAAPTRARGAALLLAILGLSACARSGARFLLEDRPAVSGGVREEDSRGYLLDYYRLGAGGQARWTWAGIRADQVVLVFAPFPTGPQRYDLNGARLERALHPGWNVLGRLGRLGQRRGLVTLTLTATGAAVADAAALAPPGAEDGPFRRWATAQELKHLKTSLRTDWSRDLAPTFPASSTPGCSKLIPFEQVCPHWPLGPREPTRALEELRRRELAGRGYLFDPLRWNATTTRCQGRSGLAASACLSCSSVLPEFVAREGVVPVGVYHPLWCNPFPGALCGACLKIHLPAGELASPKCTPEDADLYPHCGPTGRLGYAELAARPGSFPITVRRDEEGPYVIGYVTEWFDNIAGPHRSLPYSLTFATHVAEHQRYGHSPIRYRLIDCPTREQRLGVIVVDNRETATRNKDVLPWLKLKVTGGRWPIVSLEVDLDGRWQAASPAGDGHWQLAVPASLSRELGLRAALFQPDRTAELVTLRLRPADALCRYQDPDCRPFTGREARLTARAVEPARRADQ